MYSQNNEEQLILDYFGPVFKGTCIDLGANDGVTLSNTRACIERGWKGVMVDASTDMSDKLRRFDVEVHNVAMGNTDGFLTFYESGEHLGKGDRSLVSTIVASEMDRWTNETFTPVTVECVTFATLLTRSAHKTFDLISIDIEGMDLDVLRQMDLTALGCKMLIVEFNGKDQPDFDWYCAVHGMKLYAKNAENLIYVR
jgi:FkbM family methyltransferase